jgi:hypothetical protein
MQAKMQIDPADLSVNGSLDNAIQLLVDELKAVRADAQRQRGRMRVMVVSLVLLLGAAGWSWLPRFSVAEGFGAGPQQPNPMSPEDRAARRAELLVMLPADKQRLLEKFDREADWVSGYMQTWDQGKAGAVVAMMLFRMAQSMDTMPSMEQQMRTMSGQMGALPAIVAELNQINAKMHVITATMDSTMGRAGRMMPWMPFSP